MKEFAAMLRHLTVAAITLTAVAAGVAPAQANPEPKAPKEFVALSDIDPTIIQDMRYATPRNFVGKPIDGYRQPICILTETAAKALHRAQQSLLKRGYSLKVYDCYRPQRAVDHFVRWAKDLDDQRMKQEYYPNVDKSNLFADGYIAEKSGHSRGSTVDLTLVKLPAQPTQADTSGPCYASQRDRIPDNSVDMGTSFDCFDTLSHTDDPRITDPQRTHRDLLRSTLEKAGFANLPEEWWHFTHEPERFPTTYFDFPVSRSSLTGK
ncbi:M15 family metallopeptidase [Streptomyces sp. NPDC001635]